MSRFLHRGAAGNMRPLTGDDVGVIHGADGWLLICGKKYLENFRQRFPKSSFLDIKQCGEKTTMMIHVLKRIWRWCHLPGIIYRRVRGIINSLERRKLHGDPTRRKLQLTGVTLPNFIHRKVRGINIGLEWRESYGVPNKFSDTGVTLPKFSHIGVAGITPERRKDGKS